VLAVFFDVPLSHFGPSRVAESPARLIFSFLIGDQSAARAIKIAPRQQIPGGTSGKKCLIKPEVSPQGAGRLSPRYHLSIVPLVNSRITFTERTDHNIYWSLTHSLYWLSMHVIVYVICLCICTTTHISRCIICASLEAAGAEGRGFGGDSIQTWLRTRLFDLIVSPPFCSLAAVSLSRLQFLPANRLAYEHRNRFRYTAGSIQVANGWRLFKLVFLKTQARS
jgi:hypothetical protein